MSCLLDTNIAWRRIQKADLHHTSIKSAIDSLLLAGDRVYITAQILIEFRAIATRPQNAIGLGLSAAAASLRARKMEALFELLPETPAIYPQWRLLVDQHMVMGKNVHDARLVAVMHAHGVSQLMTLNPDDFRRYSNIQVITP